MQYLLTFLEGVITFISPCLLPMLPVYVSYFAGGAEQNTARTVKNSLGFIAGFTTVFVALGALAGTLGSFLEEHRVAVDVVTGLVVVFLGLNFLGVFRLNLFKGSRGGVPTENMSFFSSLLFGLVFSVGWTPCVGAFLGSALAQAGQQGTALEGVVMLLLYSLGLGIPFFLSAVLIDRLKGAFNFVKRHYKVINLVSGGLLIAVGVLMCTGLFGKFVNLLS